MSYDGLQIIITIIIRHVWAMKTERKRLTWKRRTTTLCGCNKLPPLRLLMINGGCLSPVEPRAYFLQLCLPPRASPARAPLATPDNEDDREAGGASPSKTI